MSSENDKPSVLVVLATGKLGSGIVDAFLEAGIYKVYGTSRNPCHPALLAKGVIPIEFQFGNKESMWQALHVSKAKVVVLITDLIHIAKHPETELSHAALMMEACKEAKTSHVILCSGTFCESAPKEARHLCTKLEMETYLKTKSGIDCYTILRAASFMENFDDPTNWNPLNRGYLSDLYPPNSPLPLVATRDVGKAAVLASNNPRQWNGQTLDCVSCLQTGNECADILTQVSGVKCKYRQKPPQVILRLFLPDLYHMVMYVSNGMPGYECAQDIERFRSLIPDAMSPNEWFRNKGRWADGTSFHESPPTCNNTIGTYVLLSTPILILAIIVALEFHSKE